MALKKDKLERARKAGEMVMAVRDDKGVKRDELLNYIQAHLSYGSIDLDDFAHYFFAEKGKPLPTGV